jgi:dienelactone hydrolase
VSFPRGEETLRGYLFKPDGTGPFPAIVWNHGSESDAGSHDELGQFFTSAGYVLFVPHRYGHGRSPGEYALAAVSRAGSRAEVIVRIIELHELQLQDTLAAAGWLAAQSYVDASRTAMSGVSHGGIQTLLAAEDDARIGAHVAFAPAAMSWRGNPEIQERLLGAVAEARAPIFLIQAENDFDLGPSRVLGEELARKGAPNRARIYPPYGRTQRSGHGDFACLGTEVWGSDVCGFLNEILEPTRRPAA